MSDHAIYSPSSASRWLSCPGSVKRTEALHSTGEEHNIYTASGSVIHAISELVLTAALKAKEDHRPILDQALKIGSCWGDYVDDLPPDFHNEPVTHDMIDQVETYLFHVRELVEPDDEIMIEVRLDYNDELFGTADLVLVNSRRILCCDLKSGAGNMVSPVENEQGLTYTGLLLSKMHNPPHCVDICIIQPPDEENVCKIWTTDAKNVGLHMERVEMAMESDDILPGKHCRWCPVRASCKELHSMAVNAASLELDGLNPTQWKDALELSAILKPWCESVYARANQLANEAGLVVPGYKLVDKLGRRTWASEKAAAHAVAEMVDQIPEEDLNLDDVFNPAKLRTPLQVEAALKKCGLDVAPIGDMCHTPHRGTILVSENDKRPAVETGANLMDMAERLEFFD